MVPAASRHDDGWAVFDRRPAWDPDHGRPRNFLDVPVLSHLAFYGACIQVVSEEDPYAGRLVSMHGAGIYNGRYGLRPPVPLLGAGHSTIFDATEEHAQAVIELFTRHGRATRGVAVGDEAASA